jgi:hypothetical protein
MTDSKPKHFSNCALHNGPAMVPGICSCGADPGMDPIRYGSEFPQDEWTREGITKLTVDLLLLHVQRREARARAEALEEAASKIFENGPMLTSIEAPVWYKLGVMVKRMAEKQNLSKRDDGQS